MSRVSVKAVVAGVVVDFLSGAVIAAVALAVLPGLRAEARASAAGHPTLALLVTAMLIGFPTLALGGFVAGKIARRSYHLHGAIVGTVCLIVGLAMGAENPVWYNITSAVLAIPVAMWGAVLAKSRNSAQQVVAGA